MYIKFSWKMVIKGGKKMISCNVDCYFQHEGFCCIDSIDYVENEDPELIEDSECNALNQD